MRFGKLSALLEPKPGTDPAIITGVTELRAGAARHSLEPPLGLPLIGFVRQAHDATGYGELGLETTAIALEQNGVRVVLCGVDIVGIGEPEISVLLQRVAEATGADEA